MHLDLRFFFKILNRNYLAKFL